MHNLFSFQRFGRLFRKHTAEHLREYLTGTVVLFGGLLAVMGAFSYLQSGSMPLSFQMGIFIMGMLITGGFFTSTIFKQFGAKNQAIAALCLPASSFEKYLVGWLYSFVLFLLVYVGVFYLADEIVLLLSNTTENYHETIDLFSAEEKPYVGFLLYAMLHSVMLIGAIFFEKEHYRNTGFVALSFIGIVSLLNFRVLKALFGQELVMSFPFSDLRFSTAHSFYTVGLPDEQAQWVGLVFAMLTGLCWAAAYARLREKQV